VNHSDLLRAADLIRAQAAARVGDTFRLHYHFMPPAHWMNDPNGLVYYQGYYHVFYQHNPFGPRWGSMHWGHARTKDFITWEHLPLALAPSEPYDAGGCFSGSAVAADGLLHLFYTGVRMEGDKLVQVQCRAISQDGVHFTKDPRNPLISSYPREGSADFRDPRVWRHGGAWYMAVGSGKNGRGKVLLYRSDNLSRWDYVGVAAESHGTQGAIWECPDLFPLGGKHVLLVSPVEREPRRVLCFVGEMDYAAGQFRKEAEGELDKGPDFYAAQTFFGSDRRILLAWMQSWEGEIPTQEQNWAGAFTLPRELSLDAAGRLRVAPVPELKQLRTGVVFSSEVDLEGWSGGLAICDLQSSGLEAILRVDMHQTTADEFGLLWRTSTGGEGLAAVSVSRAQGELYLDTTKARRGHRGRYVCKVDPRRGELEVRAFLDRSSIEVFGDGEAGSITARIYPDDPQLVLDMFARGGVLKASLELWELAP